MRIHRFYLNNEKLGQNTEIKESYLIHQWRDVFRMKIGEKIILFNGDSFEYVYRIEELSSKNTVLIFLEKYENKIVQNKKMILCQSIIKKDKFEWIVEKGTELGVLEFQPIISERSEKKNLNIERLKIIAKEAVEQSGRGIIPKINEPKSLKDYLADFDGSAIAFDSSGLPFKSNNYKLQTNNFLFIGPEGGWTLSELELFKSKNIPIYSLGNMTLRGETASIVASAIFLL